MADDHPDVLPADLGLVLRGSQCRRADPDRRCASEWAPPKFDSVNTLQDATTDLLETRAGFSTIAQQIAKRGYDPRKVLEEWQEFALLADTMNLIFDSDPRKVSRGGQVQSQDPGSLDAEPGKTPPDPSQT